MGTERNIILTADVLVIGSEGAGASAAVAAAERGADVIVVTKGGDVGRSGSTVCIDGDISCDSKSLYEIFSLPGSDPADSKEAFFQDMVKGGKFLNDQKLVEVHVDGAPEAVKRIMDWGVKLEKVLPAGGHTYPRGIFITGERLVPVLRKVFHKSRAKILPFTMITDLLTVNGQCVGAVGLNVQTGRFVVIKAKSVVLATGGGQRAYPVVTSPEELTGDGQFMAYRAGARLINMEFPQFIPAVFAEPPAVRGCIVPFNICCVGVLHGWLLNSWGERFMQRWDPIRMEHSTRDILSVAIMTEVEQGRGSPNGGVYVSLAHLPTNLVDNIRDVIPSKWVYKYGGFDMERILPDLSTTALEACPGCHYFNGGIKIDENCETNINGLFAAGEVTGGVHGGNRISGNACTEIFVFGHRAGLKAAEHAKDTVFLEPDQSQVDMYKERVLRPLISNGSIRVTDLRKRLQDLASSKVGVIREGKILEQALEELQEIREQIPEITIKNKSLIYNREWARALELESMTYTLEFIARSSLERKESRASLYRKDFPTTDNNEWCKGVSIEKRDGGMKLVLEPVRITTMEPPRGIYRYGFLEEKEKIDEERDKGQG